MQFMHDLETRGTTPGCAIVSVGLIAFNPFADRVDDIFVDDGYYSVVTLASNVDAFLHIDAATDEWWAKQSPAARVALEQHKADKGLALRDALEGMADYVAEHVTPRNALMWGNGADFDNPIVAVAARMVGFKLPWQWGNRCYRTTKNLHEVFGPEFTVPKKVGTVAHNALADSKDQAMHHWEVVQHVRSLLKEK